MNNFYTFSEISSIPDADQQSNVVKPFPKGWLMAFFFTCVNHVPVTDGLVRRHLAIRLDAMLQAEQLPAPGTTLWMAEIAAIVG